MNNSPLITIIIATYNAADTLQRCINSVASQTYPHKELIIMDGGSTDGTVNILQSNNSHIAYWESKPDRGIYHAWNKALPYAQGDWICFLGADDYFADSQVLEKISTAALLADKEKKKIVYGKLNLVSEKGKFIEVRGKPWEEIKDSFRSTKMAIPHPGCLHHKDVFLNHGYFDESFSICGDYELLLRELKNHDAFFCPQVITIMEHGGLSNSPAMQWRLLSENIKVRKKHGLYRFRFWTFTQQCAILLAFLVSKTLGDQWAGKLLDGYRFCLGKSKRWSI